MSSSSWPRWPGPPAASSPGNRSSMRSRATRRLSTAPSTSTSRRSAPSSSPIPRNPASSRRCEGWATSSPALRTEMGRLFARIYLHFLGVLLVVAVVASVVFAWTARGAFVQESSGRISRHISSLVAEVYRDPAALARRVHQVHEELELDLVARDIQGRVLVSAGNDLPSFTPEQLAQVRTGLRMVQPNPEWSVATPVRDPKSGAVIGTLESSAHRRSRLRGLTRPATILTLLLVLFAFPAAILARRISRPVERLTEAARRLGAGDLTARVPTRTRSRWFGRGSDELADLTRAFNDMAERIERLIAGQKELMANISHELRSPLTRIRVALELLPHNGAAQAR